VPHNRWLLDELLLLLLRLLLLHRRLWLLLLLLLLLLVLLLHLRCEHRLALPLEVVNLLLQLAYPRSQFPLVLLTLFQQTLELGHLGLS